MKWKKLGKIFDPTDRPSEYVGFAQSPQTLVFDDFVRIYFSTRKIEANGKFLSCISFVDFDLDFKQIINRATHPVIPLGKLGTFDEHGIFPINPLKHGDRLMAFTCGWSRRVSVSVETAVGFAESTDGGLTFKKMGDGPIFAASIHEPFLVGDAFVKIYQNVFHMWYIYGTQWKAGATAEAERIYKIGHATSSDGIIWNREGRQIISDRLNEDECQALPTVIEIDNVYHMFFCYRHATDFRKNKERSYRIGYAFSTDLIHWTRNDAEAGITVADTGWDSDMMCYPHVFHCNGREYMLYNGNEFGRTGFGLAVLKK